MLTIRNLRVRYGRSMTALHGVELDVPDDGVLAVLGANGAGKSTLLRAISGTLRLHRGLRDRGDDPPTATPGSTGSTPRRSSVTGSSVFRKGGRSSPG